MTAAGLARRGSGVLAVLAVLVAPHAAGASDARVESFGVQHEYLEDYSLFSLYPTVIARYANLVSVSVGDRNLQQRSVGVIASGNRGGYGVFALRLNDLGFDGGQDAQVDLAWARDFGGVTPALAVQWTESRREIGDAVQSPIGGGPLTNNLSLHGGALVDVGDTEQIEVAAEVAWLTWEETATGRRSADNLSYRFSLRLHDELNSRVTLLPLLQVFRTDRTGRGDPDVSRSDTFNLGAAFHFRVNGSDLLVVGAAVNRYEQKTYTSGAVSDRFRRWDLPALFAALEFDVYDWLTVRSGATKTLDVSNLTRSAAEPETRSLTSRYFFGLGMGLHFDHFDVDATVNPRSVFTGGYLFSGESSEPLGKVTATYYF